MTSPPVFKILVASVELALSNFTIFIHAHYTACCLSLKERLKSQLVKEKGGTSGKNPKIIDTSVWLESVYGISRKFFFKSGKDDWVLIDSKDLTEEKLREFIEGTSRLSQIDAPVPRK